jgi:hypothetical protein
MVEAALELARFLGDALIHCVNGVIFTVLKFAAAVFAANGVRFPIVAPAHGVRVDPVVAHGWCCFGGGGRGVESVSAGRLLSGRWGGLMAAGRCCWTWG